MVPLRIWDLYTAVESILSEQTVSNFTNRKSIKNEYILYKYILYYLDKTIELNN